MALIVCKVLDMVMATKAIIMIESEGKGQEVLISLKCAKFYLVLMRNDLIISFFDFRCLNRIRMPCLWG